MVPPHHEYTKRSVQFLNLIFRLASHMSKILGKRRADQLHSAAMRQDTETLRTIIRENGDAYAVLSSLAETCAIENKPDSLRVLCAEEYPMGNALTTRRNTATWNV